MATTPAPHVLPEYDWLADARLRNDAYPAEAEADPLVRDRRNLLTAYDAQATELATLRSHLASVTGERDAAERLMIEHFQARNEVSARLREAQQELGEYKERVVDALEQLLTPEGEIHPRPEAFKAYAVRMRVNVSVSMAAERLGLSLPSYAGKAAPRFTAADLVPAIERSSWQVPGMPQAKCHGCGLPSHVARCQDEACPMKPACPPTDCATTPSYPTNIFTSYEEYQASCEEAARRIQSGEIQPREPQLADDEAAGYPQDCATCPVEACGSAVVSEAAKAEAVKPRRNEWWAQKESTSPFFALIQNVRIGVNQLVDFKMVPRNAAEGHISAVLKRSMTMRKFLERFEPAAPLGSERERGKEGQGETS